MNARDIDAASPVSVSTAARDSDTLNEGSHLHARCPFPTRIPMSAQQRGHTRGKPESGPQDSGFLVWSWAGWVWGIASCLVFVYFAYPLLSAVYYSGLTTSTPSVWVVKGFYFTTLFTASGALALQATWMLFVVIRVAGDRITIARWFGLHRRIYHPNDVGTWRLVDHESRDVNETKSASTLIIHFLEGSLVSVSRHTWNFRQLEEWLRSRASGGTGSTRPASDASPSQCRFVVRDPLRILMGVGVCAACWMLAAQSIALTFLRPLHPTSVANTAAGYVVALVMVIVLLVLGPLAAHAVLREVRVEAPRICVQWWFGLIRRTYLEDDIKTWQLSIDDDPPWWRSARDSIRLTFADGPSVSITARAINFRVLQRYLRDRVWSRQESAVEQGDARPYPRS